MDIRMLEVYHNTTNQQMFAQMNRQFGISSPWSADPVYWNDRDGR